MRRVLVVGAGILGASITWHLARAGARVTVLDAAASGGVATRNSWAWINASWGNPEPYFRLRFRSMAEWRRLEREVPGLHVAWRGGLFWQQPDQLATFAAQHAAWGYDTRLVGRDEIVRLEPGLAEPPELAVHVPSEGSIEPLPAALALLEAARALGATMIADTPARRLRVAAGRVTGVETESGFIAADDIVVAGGVGSAALLASAGVALPMRHAPGLVLATTPVPHLLNRLLVSPAMELRQTVEGRLLAVGVYDDASDPSQAAAGLLEGVRRMVPGDAALVPEFSRVAYRPIPQDGFPAVGRPEGLSGLYVAVTHSGITLAPALGRFAAEEILDGVRDGLLAPYGLERFRVTAA